MTAIGHPAFNEQLADDESVARINDEAFEASLRLILEHLTR
jgi:hypothetical protein